MALDAITWLADKLLERGREREKKDREQWDRVADYFDSIAETLERMIKSFKENQIPRIEGNKLKVLISAFREVVQSVYSPDEDKDSEKSKKLLEELYHTALTATNIDIQVLAMEYYGENKMHIPHADQVALIERVAGKYRGLAAALRAKSPQK